MLRGGGLLLAAIALWGAAVHWTAEATLSAGKPSASAEAVREPAPGRDAVPTPQHEPSQIVLCQALGPAAPYAIGGVDCANCIPGCGEPGWEAARAIQWQQFAQGEYVGHAREAHVAEYRLRVDDLLEFIYRVTRDTQPDPYQLQVGDEVRVESFADPLLNRELIIQPDGSITLRLLGQVPAAGLTVEQLRGRLEQLYQRFYREPAMTVTPLRVNTRLEDLRATVDSRFGPGGQTRQALVTPEGTVQLPAIGSIFVQGMSLDELRREVNERYAAVVEGVEVIPVLAARAPRFVYVLGAVQVPGRYTLEGPTTAMQALAMAGGWIVGANLNQVVVFRRADDWRLMATMLDLRGALYGKRPCPADEIWLNDSDIIVVPRSPILVADDFIELIFTRGIYGVLPFQGISLNFAKASTL